MIKGAKGKRKILLLFLVTIASMLLGFIKESVIVFKLGATWQADVFVFASNFPIIIFSAIGTVIATTFMPLFTDVRINYSKEEANSFATAFLKAIILFCLVLIVLGEIFPELIVGLMAPGILALDYAGLMRIIRIIIPSLLFLGIAYVYSGVLNSFKDVVITSLIQLPMHFTIIISLLLIYNRFGLIAASSAVLVGSIFQMLLMYLNSLKWGYRYRKSTEVSKEYIMKSAKMMGPMIISVLSYQMILIIALRIASQLGEGSITMLNLANKLNTASYSTIGYLLVIIIYPILAEYAASKNYEKLNEIITKSISIASFLMLPVSLLMIFFSTEIIELFFGYGKFTASRIQNTSLILKFYSVGLVFWSIKDVLNRAYFALKDTKTSMYNGIITVTINLIFSLILTKYLQVSGLALASSIASVVSVVLLVLRLKNIDIELDFKKLSLSLKKQILSIIAMYFVLLLLSNIELFNMSNKLALFFKLSLYSLISIAAYMLTLNLQKSEEVMLLKDKILKKGD